MTTKQAAKLERFAKNDLKQRMSSLASELKQGKDVSYEKWLSQKQKEARIIEENL